MERLSFDVCNHYAKSGESLGLRLIMMSSSDASNLSAATTLWPCYAIFPPTYSPTMSFDTLLLATYLELLAWVRETGLEGIFKTNSEAPIARTMSMIMASLVLDGTRCCKAVV